MSQSYTAIQDLVNQGYSHDEIAAFIAIMKNESTRDFAIKYQGLMRDEDDGALVDQVNREFNQAGYSIADDAKRSTYAAELFGIDDDDLDLGERMVAFDTLCAIGIPEPNPYEKEWLTTVDTDELIECVQDISQHDSDWGVFVTPRAKTFTKRDYVKRVHTFADEKMAVGGCIGDEAMFKGFNVELPLMVAGSGISYAKQTFENVDGKDGYCHILKLRHLDEAKLNGYKKFFCDRVNAKTFQKKFRKCFAASDYVFFEYIDLKYEDDSDYEADCVESRRPKPPPQLARIYATIKAPPGRSYYMHDVMRLRTMKRMADIGYINQGIAKRIAKRPKAQPDEAVPPGIVVRDRDLSWQKEYAEHIRRKTPLEDLVKLFGDAAYELCDRVKGAGKQAITRRMVAMVEAYPKSLYDFLYKFVPDIQRETNVSEKMARETTLLFMGKSFGSYDVYESENVWMVRRHRK